MHIIKRRMKRNHEIQKSVIKLMKINIVTSIRILSNMIVLSIGQISGFLAIKSTALTTDKLNRKVEIPRK